MRANSLVANTDPPPSFSNTAVQIAIDNKTKPAGSLGRIEELAAQIAQLQASITPSMDSCELTIFAADHGIATAGVSAYPQEVTQQMVMNFLAGGAAANVFATTLDVAVRVVDAGVAGDPIRHPNLIDCRIAPGTQDFSRQAAMTARQFDDAMEYGRSLTEDGRHDAVCYGEMGIGNTSSATLILHKLFQLPIETLTGRGTGLDDEGLRQKTRILGTAANRTSTRLGAEQILIEYGGFEIVMMTAAMIQAATLRSLVIVDGFIATAAAAVAIAIEPTVRSAMVFAHTSAEHGHAAALNALGVKPLMNLDMRLGEGTGALLAWPLLRSAAAMLRDMASFESAGVSGPA